MEDGIVRETIKSIENEEEIKGTETANPETSDKKPEETPEGKSDGLVTAEIAEQYGLSKSFVGKPITEVVKSYSELQKLDSKRANEIADLKKSVEELRKNATPKETKEANKKTENELGEMPDPMTDLGAFNQWMQKRDEHLLELAEQRIEAKYEKQFQTANEISTESLMNKTFQLITEGLPENTDVREIVATYMEENKEYYEELLETGKGRTPEQIAREIVKDYKAKQYDLTQKLTQEQIEKLASDKAQQQLKKKTTQTKVSDLNTNERETKDKSLVSETVAMLEAAHKQGD